MVLPKPIRVSLLSIVGPISLCGLGMIVNHLHEPDNSASSETAATPLPALGMSSVSALQQTYQRWSTQYAKAAPQGPTVTLLWNRGLSSEYSKAKGIAQLDLGTKRLSVRIQGIKDKDISEVWLIDNQPGPGRSSLPELGDTVIPAGQLKFEKDGSAWLDSIPTLPEDFVLDHVVIARAGEEPGVSGVLYGSTTLFQKKFHYPKYLENAAKDRARNAKLAFHSGTNLLVGEAQASGITPPGFSPGLDADLVNEGRRLFFNETFDGNGRTCGTCHREDDNLALGLRTIANLPDSDPLFIVEHPTLADGSPNALYGDFRMERPALMRKLGLFVENLDGFRDQNGDFTTRAPMRAPNHVLSIRTTLAPPPAISDDGTLPINASDLQFAQRTGWSGDGTPTGFRQDFFDSNGRELTGSLRDFTIGAIVQHFTLTLERSASSQTSAGAPRRPDFRFATEHELNAMEAFMLSIGRQAEPENLEGIQLHDEIADRGRLNYMGFNVFDATPNDGRPPLNCQACHLNGGANTNPEFPFPAAVTPNHDLSDLLAAGGSIPSHNRSFGPGVERLADQAADIIVQTVDDPSVRGDCFNNGYLGVPLLPGDGPGVPSAGCDSNPFDTGYLNAPDDPLAGQRIAANRFNTPPVFEAIDNAPFFHGHQVNTVEGMVAFYASNRHFRNGEFQPAIVPLNASQIVNVARFLRVMSADFNAQSAVDLLRKASVFDNRNKQARRYNAQLAMAEIEDAIEVLEAAEIHFADAVPLLEDAFAHLSRGGARREPKPNISTETIRQAIFSLHAAQDVMVQRSTPRVDDTARLNQLRSDLKRNRTVVEIDPFTEDALEGSAH